MSALAVLDFGKTNAKLLVFGADGTRLAEARTPTASVRIDGMLCLDVETLEAWARAHLADVARDLDLAGLMISTHGCAFALLRDGALAAPILDYEQAIPSDIEAALATEMPPFSETCSPDLPGGLNWGRHLLMREVQSPGLVSGADHVLGYPQYWSWRFGGGLASEVSFLGCHSHLWAPGRGDFSSLVDRRGWRKHFPPFARAGAVTGSTEIAGRQVSVHNGVHDSNAALHAYVNAGFRDITLVSTGTWVIVFNPGCPLDRLDPDRDMLANVTVEGAPVATARFMGGREYDVISGGARCAVTPALLRAAIDRGQFAIPTFAPGGPLAGVPGRLMGPSPEDEGGRAAVATLYVALMTDLTLDLLGSTGPVILDGGLAQNDAFAGLLAALRPDQPLSVNLDAEGTAMGAAALAFEARGLPRVFGLAPAAVTPWRLSGLGAYVAAWRRLADAR